MIVVPDSDTLLHAIYLSHPAIKTHTRKTVTESIISVISEWDISSEKYIGGSFDGQYFNLGVIKLSQVNISHQIPIQLKMYKKNFFMIGIQCIELVLWMTICDRMKNVVGLL